MFTALGIDIAKKEFDAALIIREEKFRDRTFTNNPAGFEKLLAWLSKQGVEKVHACIEATGTYSQDLAIFLVERGHRVSLVNPAQIKSYGESKLSRNKTDKQDAHLIALYCQRENPPAWTPPPSQLRQLQALVRHLDDLISLRQQEENRLTSGVSAQAVIDSLTSIIKFLDAEIAKTEKLIRQHIDQHPHLKNKRDLLVSIPGIGEKTAARLLAEFGHLHNASARQLTAYAGLTPKQHDSGTSVRKRPRLSKIGNSNLRKALYFPAIVAKRHNPIINAFCQRLKDRGKAKMAIIGAAMRKLLHIVYGVLKSQCPFDAHYQKAS
jgi:transposase